MKAQPAARLKGEIEAVLFLTGRALQVAEIAEKLAIDAEVVEETLLDLITDYASRETSALEIDDTDGYILQIKDEYSAVVNRMVPIELTTAAVRTLSAIALHGPILQSDLIEIRGANAYEHIKELVRHQLISRKRKDRTYLLNVATKFYEYFKLTGDKNELKALVSELSRRTPAQAPLADEEILAEDVLAPELALPENTASSDGLAQFQF